MLVEPFILGKLVSFFGGINNLYRKPAGTIQLIGAEKAFFRHKAISSYGPKYGFIFKSKSAYPYIFVSYCFQFFIDF
jgi:nucleolar protein 56